MERSRKEEGGDYNELGRIPGHSWVRVGAMEVVRSGEVLVTEIDETLNVG